MTNQENLQREVDQYVSRTPRSRDLQANAEKYLPGGSSRGTAFFGPYPHFIERGEGHYMIDADGNKILDFMINATSLILGHAHPDIVAALQEQAAKGTAFTGPTEAQVRLAKILTERIPSMDTVRFTNSGTEGTLMSIRAARAFTGKHKIAKFEGGYHGSHEYVAVSVHPPLEKLDPAGPTPIPEHPGMPPSVLEDVIVLPYNDLEWCERVLRENKDDLACLIMEPVVSSFGYLPAQKEFLQGLRSITTELDIILIFDEVQSLRIASGGAQETLGVTPDMTSLGKIIGGGMAVGAFGGRQDLMDLLNPTDGATIAHAGTFNANPVTMLAGAATLEELTPDVYRKLAEMTEYLRAGILQVGAELETPVQVTGLGSLFGIHFTGEELVGYRDIAAEDSTFRHQVFLGLLNEGILMASNLVGAVSTEIGEKEIDTFTAALRRVLERALTPSG